MPYFFSPKTLLNSGTSRLVRSKERTWFSHEEVLQEVTSIENLLTLLPDIPAIYPIWKQVVQDHRVQDIKVYDARLIAVMSHAVDSVLTFNPSDFKRFGVGVLQPTVMLA